MTGVLIRGSISFANTSVHPTDFDGVRVAHLFSFQCCVVLCCFVCLRPVYCLSPPCVLFVSVLCLVCLRPVYCLSPSCVFFVSVLCLVCLRPVYCLSPPCVLFVPALCLVCLRPVSCLSPPYVLCAHCSLLEIISSAFSNVYLQRTYFSNVV